MTHLCVGLLHQPPPSLPQAVSCHVLSISAVFTSEPRHTRTGGNHSLPLIQAAWRRAQNLCTHTAQEKTRSLQETEASSERLQSHICLLSTQEFCHQNPI